MSAAGYQLLDATAVITLDNPPVNGLGHALRLKISQALEQAQTDPAVRTVLIIGNASGFSGGADIREFGTPRMLAAPTLGRLLQELEMSALPVVAAISGNAMGGGLELALACHYRVATADAQLAFPEVKLGLIPGAGGTQRLPRAVGLETALNMIVSGNTVAAAQLAGAALFDRMIEGELLAGALRFAREISEVRPLPLLRRVAVRYAQPDAFLQFARNTVRAVARNLPAPLAAIDALAAALGDFEQGMRKERELFIGLLHSSESAALRHAFFAERAAAKIPDLPEGTAVRDIHTAAVVGAGTMGGGIAMSLANAGIAVTMLDATQEALERGLTAVRRNYEASAKKGRLSGEQLQQRLRLIRGSLAYEDVAGADIIIEAVFEDLDVKGRVFRELDRLAKPEAILATNTSTLDVDKIAAFTHRPAAVLGTHFFSPANVMRLLEIVRGKATSPEVLASAMRLAKRLKKVGVVSGVCDGFIGNRMIAVYGRQSELLLLEGCLPQQLDGVLESWGMAMGPCRMADLAGLDVGAYIRKRHYAERPGMRRSTIADALVDQGRYGQKSGAGYYRYPSGTRDALPDPEVERIILAQSRALGVTRRAIEAEEIVERCIFALVNEGARILEEGIAQRASDIDVVYLNGYGFPVYRGGPMFYADTAGLHAVLYAMRRFAANPNADPGSWEPAPLLARLAAQGKTFNDAASGKPS
jgi:3-hydroxyacyl-CoA dehydrogenase